MKKKNTKGLIIILISLIIICLLCGTIGCLESKKEVKPKDDDKNKKYEVTYRYYIDGEEVDEEVKKETLSVTNPDFEGAEDDTLAYTFERYTCTAGVDGVWDEDEWKFTPDLTANTTCRLYFLKNVHTITFKANNGELPSKETEEKVEALKDKETVINVKPNDGYKYDKVECTNGATAEFSAETNDLTVTNVTKDTTCSITFKISDYSVEVSANFGTVTGEKSKSVTHGGNLEFDITAAENYAYDSVDCTNNQKASYVNGKLTIRNITSDTKCTVDFKPLKYKVTLNIEGGKMKEGYSSPVEVSEGNTATFAVVADEGYTTSKMEVTCTEDTKADSTLGQGIIKVFDIRGNITCKATLKKVN